jgi:tellurite resistance protein TehA-like permease
VVTACLILRIVLFCRNVSALTAPSDPRAELGTLLVMISAKCVAAATHT